MASTAIPPEDESPQLSSPSPKSLPDKEGSASGLSGGADDDAIAPMIASSPANVEYVDRPANSASGAAPELQLYDVQHARAGQPFELAVRIRWQAQGNSHPVIEFRSESLGKNDARQFAFGDWERVTFRLNIPYEGTFTIEFSVEADGLGQFVGEYRLHVLGERDSGPIFQIHQNTEAKHAIGQEINVNISGEMESLSASGRALVAIPLKSRQSGHVAQVSTLAKRPWLAFDASQRVYSRLSLRIRTKAVTRNICLIGARDVTLGKQRGCDIVLRLLPPARLEKIWNRISRKHGEIGFTANGVEWRNGDCLNGTLTEGRSLKSGEVVSLKPIHDVRLADALGLRCVTFRDGLSAGHEQAYSRFDASLGNTPAAFEPLGPVAALRITRIDNFRAMEEYIVVQRGCTLGQDPSNAVVISDTSIAMRHALVLFTAHGFWIEPLQPHGPIAFNGEAIPQHHLLHLTPGMTLHIGRVEVTVNEMAQWYIDMIPPE